MEAVDKVNLTLSTLSIVMTVALAVAGYYWFVPAVREYQLRGRLEVSGRTPSPPYPLLTSRSSDTVVITSPTYQIDVHNAGTLPAKDVQIVVRYSLTFTKPRDRIVALDPPIPIEANDDRTQILLKGSIAPDAHVQVNFSETPVTIWVLSETGEATVVQAGGPEFIQDDLDKRIAEIGFNFPVDFNPAKRPSKGGRKRLKLK